MGKPICVLDVHEDSWGMLSGTRARLLAPEVHFLSRSRLISGTGAAGAAVDGLYCRDDRHGQRAGSGPQVTDEE